MLTETTERWVPVARLANLAEVGYFADHLAGHDIPTDIRQHNEFSALDGSWRTVFILCVPPELAASAASCLEEELQRTADDAHAAPFLFPSAAAIGDAPTQRTPLSWRTVLLILLAGGIAYLAGRGALAPPESPPAEGSLWRAIRNLEQPLTTEAVPGQPRYRLRWDRGSEHLLLEEDLNGDGRFERQRRFAEGREVPP